MRVSKLFGRLHRSGNGGQTRLRQNVVRQHSAMFSAMPARQDEISVTVDGTAVRVPAGTTVMQACAAAGVDIPRFCYHERLAIAGNCRMCLVQINNAPKLAASCAMPVAANMAIDTRGETVRRAREGVMEFLLANHPLDCPVCDQGGECDLQDQAMAFGSDTSRYTSLAKRAVADKDFGPLVATSMNRCIHCTRCVRFASEIAGFEPLGTLGRGGSMEIGTYVSQTIGSNLSGNLIDLCPVGALTSKPYAFTARPWELRSTDSVDVMDALGSAIRIDALGVVVKRILPRTNEAINEEWLADKGRFACDALQSQRLCEPMQRVGTRLQTVSWETALLAVAKQMRLGDSHALVGAFADAESTFLAQTLFTSAGLDAPASSGAGVPADLLPLLLNHTTIAGIEEADCLVIVGCDVRNEAPLLNARIRKGWLAKPTDIYIVGPRPRNDPTYTYTWLGEEIAALDRVPSLRQYRRPAIVVGHDLLLSHPHAAAAHHKLMLLCKRHAKTLIQLDSDGVRWNGLAFVPVDAARTAALLLGLQPTPLPLPRAAKLLYLLNSDNPLLVPHVQRLRERDPALLVVYQGHHGDVGAALADIVLPGAAYTEKNATYVNMEGRAQQTVAAVPPAGRAREDWMVLRALAEVARLPCAHDSVGSVRAAMAQHIAPFSAATRRERSVRLLQLIKAYAGSAAQTAAAGDAAKIARAMDDYYLSDCISRNSVTMVRCSHAFAP